MIQELKIVHTKHIERPLKEGVLYISKEYNTAIHLCICGCGVETVTPFSHIINGRDHGWHFTFENDDQIVTLRPSIGNFSPPPYHAHYYITKNRIELCEPIRPELIKHTK